MAVAGDVLTLFCAFGAMLYLSPRLTLVYLGIGPLVWIVSVIFRRRARSSFRDVRKAVAKLASFLQECFTGISEIQVFNHEQRRSGRLRRHQRRAPQGQLPFRAGACRVSSR